MLKSLRIALAAVVAYTSLIAPRLAHADSRNTSCVSAKKNVSFTTAIALVTFSDGRKGSKSMTRPIVLQPQYAFTATASDKNVLIVPTSNRTIISKNDRHIQSGGDEEEVRWDTKFRQSFIFMAHDGGNLSGDFRTEFKRIDATVEGQTDDGYVVIEMLCRDWGSSSSGGNRSFDDAGPVLEN